MGPPRTLTRGKGMQVYEAVCQKLGANDFSFKYSTGDAQPGGPRGGKSFQIAMERPQGTGQFRIVVDNQGPQAPVRLLVEYPWPKSREHVFEDVDLAVEAAFEALGEDWNRVLAETRVRAQVEAKGDSAAVFLAGEILHLSEGEIGSLEAPISFLGIKYETEAADPVEGNPLAHPKREVSVEVLREDPRSLYVELMCQWPQTAAVVRGGTLEIDTRKVRTFSQNPSEYLRNSIDYLNSVVLPLFSRS